MAKNFEQFNTFHKKEAETEPDKATEAYNLIDTINHRYADLDFSSTEFHGLSEREKLEKLITRINHDREIARLNNLSMIGSIIVFSQVRDTPSAGWGRNLCVGNDGLYIYDWNDYENKHDNVSVSSPDALEQLGVSLSCEDLREAIVAYTNREGKTT